MPVLFCDLDNTLVDRTVAFRAWSEAMLDEVRFPSDRGIEYEWLEEEDRDGFRSRTEFLDAVRDRYSVRQPLHALERAYRRDFPAFTPPPSPRTVSALAQARRSGWKIALVTNGSSAQQSKIVQAGLDQHLDACCISEEVGHRKPDPEIFRIAAKRCGSRLDGGWMIGDSPSADIGGAVAARLDSVWISRGRRWVERSFSPTLSADSFSKAVEAILGRDI